MVTCNDHQSHDLPVAEEEDELEQITLDSCIQQNANEILIRMGNNLKVTESNRTNSIYVHCSTPDQVHFSFRWTISM